MAEGGSSQSSQSLKMDIVLSDDRRSASIKFIKENKSVAETTVDTEQIESIIQHLGTVRGNMLELIPNDMPQGTLPLAAYDPRWCILPNSTNTFATFWIRHPNYGWSGFGFPRHEVSNIAKWLRKVVSITSNRDTQSSTATHLFSEKFLLTTEGLGFYYYGKDEKRIGPNPFEQIETDSDRAAGIVAGSIVESRLEQALQSRLRNDKPIIITNLFRPSGALGPVDKPEESGFPRRDGV